MSYGATSLWLPTIARDRGVNGKMLIEPTEEWHFYRLINGPQGRGYKKL